MNADQSRAWAQKSQAFDRAVWPLEVTIQGVALAAAGSVGLEELAGLQDGGHVRNRTVHFSISKDAWTESGLPAPTIGMVATVEGVRLAVKQISGKSALDPNWNFRAEINPN